MCSAFQHKRTPHRDELYIDPVSESGKQGRFFVSDGAVVRESDNGVAAQTSKDFLPVSHVQSDGLEAPAKMPSEPSSSSFIEDTESDELEAFLALVQHDESYRVDEVLKESSYEITQKVSWPGEAHISASNVLASAPAISSAVSAHSKSDFMQQNSFIRKYINMETGLGRVYETLYDAQQAGYRFRFLPRIYECYHLRNQLVVVMEFIQGETLQEVVYRNDPSPELACDVFPRVCAAVEELHEGFNPPIIHRDLKPANIIMGWDRLTLIDFGIARVYRPGLMVDTSHFGTREYAPPEQFGYGQTDVRSDVYALGMLLYYCLTEENAGVEARQAQFVDARIPEAFRVVIEKATAFDPQARYESVRALRQAFEQVVEHIGVDQQKMGNCAQKSMSGNVLGGVSAYSERCGSVGYGSSSASVGLEGSAAPTANSVDQRTAGHASRVADMRAGKPGVSLADTRTEESSTNPPDIRAIRGAFKNLGAFLTNKTPAWLGRIWNGLLLLSWALFMAACISLVFNPTAPSDIKVPLWFRAFEYMGVFGILITATAYVLLDRRRLRKRFSWLQRIPWWAVYVAYIALVALLIALYSIVYLATIYGH